MTGAIEDDDLGHERPNDQRAVAASGTARDEGDQVRAHRCASRVETASLPPLIARRLECVVVRKTCGAWALLGERYDPLARTRRSSLRTRAGLAGARRAGC